LLQFLGAAVLLSTVSTAAYIYLLNGSVPFRDLLLSSFLGLCGLALLLCGLLWRHIGAKSTDGVGGKLSEWAGSPATYAFVLLFAWAALMAMAIILGWHRANELTLLRNDQQTLATVLRHTALPRHLTKEQQETMANFLRQFDPHDYSLVAAPNDDEARAYGVEIQQTLNNAGWRANYPEASDHVAAMKDGLAISFAQTPAHYLAGANSRDNPKDAQIANPSVLLQEAFALGGVRLNAISASKGPDNLKADQLVILVGPRKAED
jgi:hypothetical protein